MKYQILLGMLLGVSLVVHAADQFDDLSAEAIDLSHDANKIEAQQIPASMCFQHLSSTSSNLYFTALQLENHQPESAKSYAADAKKAISQADNAKCEAPGKISHLKNDVSAFEKEIYVLD